MAIPLLPPQHLDYFIILLTDLLLPSLTPYSLFLSQQLESFFKNVIQITLIISLKTPKTSQTGVKSSTLAMVRG